MILFPHMLVGAAIGAKVHSFPAIFIIAIILHFTFDALPHWEYGKRIDPNAIPVKGFFIFCLQATLDFSIGALALWFFWKDSPYFYYLAFGGTVSLLPDMLIFFYLLLRFLFNFESKILKKFYHLHHNVIHIPKTKNSLLWGIIIESSAVILAIYLLLT